MGLLANFIRLNRKASAIFDSNLLPPSYSVDGMRDFEDNFVSKFIESGMHVYDVGGGKNPFFSVDAKNKLNLHVTGLDIDQNELLRSPPGAYDSTIAADISNYRGSGDADIVICKALLEHVRDNASSFAALASMIKPGGKILIFVPSNYALFAQLNKLMPEELKKLLLFKLFPETRQGQGFPSFYDKCTPNQFKVLAKKFGLHVVDSRHYYVSSYFSFFFPLYVAWRLWVVAFRLLRGTQAAETFSMALSMQPS